MAEDEIPTGRVVDLLGRSVREALAGHVFRTPQEQRKSAVERATRICDGVLKELRTSRGLVVPDWREHIKMETVVEGDVLNVEMTAKTLYGAWLLTGGASAADVGPGLADEPDELVAMAREIMDGVMADGRVPGRSGPHVAFEVVRYEDGRIGLYARSRTRFGETLVELWRDMADEARRGA
jgi:hypothetical protein